jgi:excisionase family DNA binding protein
VTAHDAPTSNTTAHAQVVEDRYSLASDFARVQAISRKVAAERLAVSIGTIDNMVRRGELEAYKVAGCTRIPEREIARLMGGAGALPVRAMSFTQVYESDSQAREGY